MKKRKIIIIFIIIFMILVIGAIIVFSGVIDPNNQVLGNNLTGSFYSEGLGNKVYDSIENALQDVDEHYKEQDQISVVQTGNVAIAFMLGQNQIGGYEFVTADDRYYYKGRRFLSFAGSMHRDSYDWETTMRSDLSNSTKKLYRNITRIGKKYTVLPAWGISDEEQVKDVTVDNQGVDKVFTFSQDGTDYYLWIIYDLQTKNDAVDLVIQSKY